MSNPWDTTAGAEEQYANYDQYGQQEYVLTFFHIHKSLCSNVFSSKDIVFSHIKICFVPKF